MDPILSPVLLFTGFAVFHSVCAQEFFKLFLKNTFGGWFEEHCWRLIYSIISWWFFFRFIDALYAMPVEFAQKTLFPVTPFYEACRQFCRLIGLIVLYWAWVQMNLFNFLGVTAFARGLYKLFSKDTPAWLSPDNNFGVTYVESEGLYRYVRHPAYTGSLLMLAGDVPNVRSLIFLTLSLAYILIGAYFEERKMIKKFGADYLAYRNKTGMLIPGLVWRKEARRG